MARDVQEHRRRVTCTARFPCQREFICTYSPPDAFWVITAEGLQTTTVAVKSPMFSRTVPKMHSCIQTHDDTGLLIPPSWKVFSSHYSEIMLHNNESQTTSS